MDKLTFEAIAPQFLFVRCTGAPAEGRVAEYFMWMTDQMNSGSGGVLVMDSRRSELWSGTFIKQQGKWLRENHKLIAQKSLGTAIVLGQPVLRFALSSILSIAPTPAPLTAHDTLFEALDWAMGRLRESGAPVPDAMLEMSREAALEQAGPTEPA
jgi:hypothetical protein